VESLNNERAEAAFKVGERADFLNQVQNVDNNTGVRLPLGGMGSGLSPFFARGTTKAKSRNKPRGSVTSGSRGLGNANGVTKSFMNGPRTIVPEDGRAGNVGRDSC
jgi:hypothetical protein